MAKSMRNNRREKKKILKDRALLVRAALDQGAMTRSDLCKICEFKLNDLVNLFAEDRELFAEYKVRRKTIVDQAADNIHAIVNDKNHPKHYEASKYILQNYKSDLDEVLESQDGEMLQIGSAPQVDGVPHSPMVITFTKPRK